MLQQHDLFESFAVNRCLFHSTSKSTKVTTPFWTTSHNQSSSHFPFLHSLLPFLLFLLPSPIQLREGRVCPQSTVRTRQTSRCSSASLCDGFRHVMFFCTPFWLSTRRSAVMSFCPSSLHISSSFTPRVVWMLCVLCAVCGTRGGMRGTKGNDALNERQMKVKTHIQINIEQNNEKRWLERRKQQRMNGCVWT